LADAGGGNAIDPADLPPDRRDRLAAAVPLLTGAAADARETGADPWQFAVTFAELVQAGLRAADLRWLVAAGLAGHAAELPAVGDRRKFRPTRSTGVGAASCFLLTPAGARYFETPAPGARPAPPAPVVAVPRWDANRRELTFRGLLVKRFRTPADCQESILAAFEEEGWPPRIDDPLSRRAGRDGRQHLHHVVRSLNRNQRGGRIRFGRDGHGQGVCWAPGD
jgi:hypothetical protein